MNRRQFLQTLAAASTATLLGAKPSPTRPNIVFIYADDLGYGDLSSYGATTIRTPNIDRLAAEGSRFTSHYSGAPVCADAPGGGRVPRRVLLLLAEGTAAVTYRGGA